ncbi:hypothetical protein ACIRBX_35760, partial [Kitasatospora sp. NPDC096147]
MDGEALDDGELPVDGEELDDGVPPVDGDELPDCEPSDLVDGEASVPAEPSLPPESPPRPAAWSNPPRACEPAFDPRPSRNDSVNVCPEFLTASLNSSAPVFAVRPRS